MKPQTQKMSVVISAIGKSVTSVHKRQVVKKPDVALHCGLLDFVSTTYCMQSVESLSLGFSQPWNSGSAWTSSVVSHKQAPGEIGDELVVFVMEQGAEMIWWIPSVSKSY